MLAERLLQLVTATLDPDKPLDRSDLALLAQQMDQQQARFSEDFDIAVVDRKFDVHFGHCCPPLQRARSMARAIARRTVTPATWTRKSTGPCPSAEGLVIRCARRAASAIAASSTPVPTSASPACWANKGVSARLVSAIAAEVQTPFVIVTITAAAAVA